MIVKKRLVILGSTGSIGTQALDIVRRMPDRFEIVGLAAHSNADLLARQANEFHVPSVSIGTEALLPKVRAAAGNSRVLVGPHQLVAGWVDRSPPPATHSPRPNKTS